MKRPDRERRWGWRSSRAAVALSLAFLGCGSPDIDQRQPSPNILLILVDDLRPDLGTYGHPRVQTPAIDRLAAGGLRFDSAYAQYPACNPSRTSILTGLRPDTTGVLDNRTPFPDRIPTAVTLPALLQGGGYVTASVGKVFHGSGRKGRWTDPEAWDISAFPRVPRIRPESKPEGRSGRVGRYWWRSVPDGSAPLVDERRTDRAIQVLEDLRAEPFFLAVGLTATHPHFEAPQEFFDLYPLDRVPLPLPPSTEVMELQQALRGWSDESVRPFSDHQKRELIRAYWACVSFVDSQVGRMMQALARLDLARRTVVVLTSDHGYHLGEQGWWSKHTLYEAATRVPLIISGPGVAAGNESGGLVELVDLYPTLAQLAGISPPDEIEGRSLVPLLVDPERSWKQAAFSQVSLAAVEGRSLRTDRWRYSEWRGARQAIELYDLAAEPTESRNLAGDPAYLEIRQRLGVLLRHGG